MERGAAGPAGVAARIGDAPVSALERAAWDAGRAVVGIDEVGRGAWAGPVTVAAVVLDPTTLPSGARDSKRLSPGRRTEVATSIHAHGLVGIGHSGSAEIDALGLAAALTNAARRALGAVLDLQGAPEHPLVLIDGPHDLVRVADVEVATMIRGDAGSVSIAAASIVAKVDRDALMTCAAEAHPPYGFASNKGYPSPAHVAALGEHGPCELHRMSWAPLARLGQPTLEI
jgi:ribonuclease HII